MSTKLIPISIVVAGIIIAGAFVYINLNQNQIPEESLPENNLSSQEAGEKVMNFINQELLNGEATASLINVSEEENLYKINFEVEGTEYDFFLTKNGRLLFLQSYDFEPKAAEVEKRDIPNIKLFVMSYCPYGLQAQKMFLPVYDLLKDKTDMAIYFVDYIMHGEDEIEENLNQYCIQKEQKEKYYDYLSCFVVSGDSENCLSRAAIDESKLASCLTLTDQQYKITELYNDQSTWLQGYYPQFNVNSDLNEEYNVGGSPTIIINDQETDINPRSPENFKETICSAFNSPPEECNQTLSEEIPSPGIGGGTGSSSSGSCQ